MTLDMPARRLEDQIRELCTRLLYEEEPRWTATARELQIAIGEHTRRLAERATADVALHAEVWQDRRGRV